MKIANYWWHFLEVMWHTEERNWNHMFETLLQIYNGKNPIADQLKNILIKRRKFILYVGSDEDTYRTLQCHLHWHVPWYGIAIVYVCGITNTGLITFLLSSNCVLFNLLANNTVFIYPITWLKLSKIVIFWTI